MLKGQDAWFPDCLRTPALSAWHLELFGGMLAGNAKRNPEALWPADPD